MPSHLRPNKKYFWPTFLTTPVLNRALRRAYRGILTMGVREYHKQIRLDKTTKFANELSVVAIMKNEGKYIKEWLDFHILVGVTKFYLYDNESSDDTVEILKPYIKSGVVEYIYWPGRAMQKPAYIDAITRFADDTRYMALIDLDEFLVPVKHRNLVSYLKTLPRFSQLVISWVNYGSNGHKKQPKGLVIENYTRHGLDRYGVKSIINPRMITFLGNPHYNFVAGPTIDENGTHIGGVHQEHNPTTINKIRCNHYQTKSYEEYLRRCGLGDVATGEAIKVQGKDVETNFRNFDKNDVHDNIMDKYVKKLKSKK